MEWNIFYLLIFNNLDSPTLIKSYLKIPTLKKKRKKKHEQSTQNLFCGIWHFHFFWFQEILIIRDLFHISNDPHFSTRPHSPRYVSPHPNFIYQSVQFPLLPNPQQSIKFCKVSSLSDLYIFGLRFLSSTQWIGKPPLLNLLLIPSTKSWK